ncbi:helix-turn-helix domain-containing protein [Nocardioides dongkuii]|uniref:helix-turn-helix domain-containing protein n=1 Tax=Nocardioides dongkuii TaxID=2760089 RepID=UPI001C6FDEB7|nr:helix-turn-helix transcriptional regulator [Nocardioides dongkuii]
MSELGEYLRSQRERLTPAQVDVPHTGHRRVPGLRREEVAMLAGISVDYYGRLEQGRERSPSTQLLEALAAALRLDDDGRQHLFRLAGLAPRAQPGPTIERVDPRLRQLMDAWKTHPALVVTRAYDVLVANELGDALFGWSDAEGKRRDNLMALVFLEPRGRSLYRDWDRVAIDSVAAFRLGHGADPHHPRTQELLAELLSRSPEFQELWAKHDARGKSAGTKEFVHPEVGPLTLHAQAFDVRSAPGQELVVYHAEAGSPSAAALDLLGTLAATARRHQPAPDDRLLRDA